MLTSELQGHLRQLCSGRDVLLCKKANLGLGVIMVLVKHRLHVQIGVTAVVDEPRCIALVPCIQHIRQLPADTMSISLT